MNVVERIIEKEKKLQKIKRGIIDSINAIAPNDSETIINLLKKDADIEIEKLNKKYDYNEDNIKNEEYVQCNHDLVIKCHESMLIGKRQIVPSRHDLSSYGIEDRYQPNPNHIRYYCVGCGKMLNEDEIKDVNEFPWNYVIDLFGHPDSLTVGYYHFKAAIDYIRSEIVRMDSYNAPYDKNKMINYIEDEFNGKRIPEQYVRTKSK